MGNAHRQNSANVTMENTSGSSEWRGQEHKPNQNETKEGFDPISYIHACTQDLVHKTLPHPVRAVTRTREVRPRLQRVRGRQCPEPRPQASSPTRGMAGGPQAPTVSLSRGTCFVLFSAKVFLSQPPASVCPWAADLAWATGAGRKELSGAWRTAGGARLRVRGLAWALGARPAPPGQVGLAVLPPLRWPAQPCSSAQPGLLLRVHHFLSTDVPTRID